MTKRHSPDHWLPCQLPLPPPVTSWWPNYLPATCPFAGSCTTFGGHAHTDHVRILWSLMFRSIGFLYLDKFSSGEFPWEYVSWLGQTFYSLNSLIQTFWINRFSCTGLLKRTLKTAIKNKSNYVYFVNEIGGTILTTQAHGGPEDKKQRGAGARARGERVVFYWSTRPFLHLQPSPTLHATYHCRASYSLVKHDGDRLAK